MLHYRIHHKQQQAEDFYNVKKLIDLNLTYRVFGSSHFELLGLVEGTE